MKAMYFSSSFSSLRRNCFADSTRTSVHSTFMRPMAMAATQNAEPASAPTSAKITPSPSGFYLCGPDGTTPAARDATHFEEDPSVSFWRDWKDPYSNAPTAQAALENFRTRLQRSGALDSAQGALYWGYHCSRSIFFLLSGLVGATGSNTKAGKNFVGTSTTETLKRASLFISEALATFKQDFDNIQAGKYKMPYDLEEGTRHRQFSPLYVADKLTRFVRESSLTLGRMSEQTPDSVWLSSPMFPDYYKTFHYQTEGWLSSWSAQSYEFNTEVLFAGRQDAMQRLALVPLRRHLEGKDPRDVRILEVACGTGRFHTYIRDNMPAAKTTAMDLSPYYLEKARENYKYWVELRCNGSDVGTTDFVMANAESMPFPDASYDVVTSTYLFHELPPQARIRVLREVGRVLKPGGLFIFNDSIQFGDKPELDSRLPLFTKMNEPHYCNYLDTDFGKMASEEAGLVPQWKAVSSRTKTLTFLKPNASDN